MSRVNHVCTEHKYQQCNMVRKRNSNVARQWNSGSEHYHILATSTDLRQLAMWRLLIPRDTSCLQVQSLPGEPATRWSHTAPTGSGNQSHDGYTQHPLARGTSHTGHTQHPLARGTSHTGHTQHPLARGTSHTGHTQHPLARGTSQTLATHCTHCSLSL